MNERFAGRFRLLRTLGKGGMGEVFLARDLTTRTECALKRLTLAPDLLPPDALAREFDALTRVRHPAVVAVYELAIAPDGTPYYTMEFVPGRPADIAVPRGDLAALAFVAARVAHGLEALHAAGVLHGDLKPSNVLVIPGARPGALPAGVRLLDFGLAALRGGSGPGYRGTPGYAAPELVRGEAPTVASDLYGFGATLYALITGRPAFEAADASTLLRRQQSGPPPASPLEDAGAPAALVQLVLRLMAPTAAERPRDAREARRELERIHPAARRPLAERLDAVTLVGRDRPLATLTGGAREVRLFVVEGEAGAGKSALLDTAAVRASLAGQWVARLAAPPAGRPGTTARALARRLAAGAGAEIEESHDPDSPLRRFLEHGEVPGERELASIVADAAGWIRAIGERDGAAIVLVDDAENLEALSRAFLRRLVLHPGAGLARWVWAGRPATGEAAVEQQMLVESGVAALVALGPLERADVAPLAAARLGEPAPDALVAFLWERAGGHPGLTVELLRAAATAGAISESDTGIVADTAALARVGVPADFEAGLMARLAALGPGAGAAAAALAIWGHPVESARLAALDRRADAAALEALVHAGLATSDEAGLARLAPPALAARILEALGPAERRALHDRALADISLGPAERFAHLRAMEDVDGALDAAEIAFIAAPDERLAAEAAALAEPDAPARAALWHERAARALSDRGRFAEAIPHAERALALEPRSEHRPERWELLANACFRGGRIGDVDRVVGEALTEPTPPMWRARLLVHRVGALRSLKDLAGAIAAAREAAESADRSGDDLTLGFVRYAEGLTLLSQGRVEESAARVAEAGELFVRVGHRLGELRVLNSRALAATLLQRVGEAEQMYSQAIVLARSSGIREAEEELLLNQSGLFTSVGRWAEATRTIEEAVRIAMEDARPTWGALAMANVSITRGLTGDGREALRRGRAAVLLARRHYPRGEPTATRALAQAHRVMGRLRSAARLSGRALALAASGTLPEEIVWCTIERSLLRLAEGTWRGERDAMERVLDRRPESGSPGFCVLGALSGMVALRESDAAAALMRLEEATRWLAGRTAPYAAAFADRLASEIALAEGRTADALEPARRALAGFEALPAPWDRATAALEFARIALDRDPDTRAPVGEWLEIAATTFERLGDQRNRLRALAREVRWLRRPGLQPTVIGPDRNLIEAVSRLLNSLSDLPELAQRAMRMAVEQLDAERGVLLLIEPDTGQLAPIAEFGGVDAVTRRDAVGYSRRVVERVTAGGGSMLIGDAPTDPGALSESMIDMRLRSIVCVPMFLGGKVIGAVYLDDSRRADLFGAAERGLLEGFAQLMAVAIENSRGQEEVRRANESLVDENLQLRQEVSARFQPQNIVGSSSPMQRILAMASRAALTNTTVLMTGENGTGKELLARVIHHSGRRRDGPFVGVNCGAITETLLESELFGILPNVATGVKGREGRFVQADGGTLFLDEIGEMPPRQQVALLSALANREITPVGGRHPIHVDVRIISATNRDLTRAVAEGAFREDLFYRLNVIPIEVPPLRERKADIPALAHYFTAHFAEQQERKVPELSAEFMAALMQSDWPGNVRELQNYIERILAMSPGPVLYPDPPPHDLEARGALPRVGRGHRLSDVVDRLERKLISEALERAKGNQSLAARELGMTEQSIRYKIRKYGLSAREKLRIR